MWIFTRDGFFSAVAHRDDPEKLVLVRARNRAHLEKLADWHQDAIGRDLEILEDDEADYIVRAKMTKAAWAVYLTTVAVELDYTTNVKGNIMERTDPLLGDAMLDTWESLLNYQRMMRPASATGF